MSYPVSSTHILDVLEDLFAIVSQSREYDSVPERFIEEALHQAQDLINDCGGESERILTVVSKLLKSEDGTFSMAGNLVNRSRGYQVGGVVPTLVNPTRDELIRFVEEARARWPLSRTMSLGRWTDAQGQVHFDVSEYVLQYYDALILGRDRDEQEVWSWSLSRCEPVTNRMRPETPEHTENR